MQLELNLNLKINSDFAIKNTGVDKSAYLGADAEFSRTVFFRQTFGFFKPLPTFEIFKIHCHQAVPA